MSTPNQIRQLEFSDEFIEAYLVENVKDFIVEDGIVVNLDNDTAKIGGPIPTIVPAWKSTILHNGIVSDAKRIAVFNVRSETNLGGLTFGKWDWFGNRFAKFPRTTPLYISQYDYVTEIKLDPFVFANQRKQSDDIRKYQLRLNLWWSPTNTDCYMHNEHPFIEIHTQIYGTGRIQKFRERDDATLYGQITMAPGYTHDPFAYIAEDGLPRYPWHRYWSDSDAIWLAIEFHPL
ncbi:hypothetical protein [Pectobacterium sp. A5351]|uniref:hypothetical protein n=1 Tax=Pectobacterium sp. A5351 TaxID=2914983 RepID=UPI002330A4B1|nr:hypothetical protein [Pectobacterium sp. A5351]WCG84653.1 hypothetical protein O1Q74_08610 [Pectobacterium sp. A5351]